jgi:DNA-binding XRE family transcriptional regulator
LLWRFESVTSCPEHQCLLLDRCGRCGDAISFLTHELQIGVCPKCGHKFGQSLSPSTSQATNAKTLNQVAELKFLLTNQPFEANIAVLLERMGVRLSQLRIGEGIARDKMAQLLNTSLTTIIGIERNESNRYGSTFAAYTKYLDFFGIKFSEFFQEATHLTLSKRTRSKDYYNELEKEIELAIRSLEQAHKKVTQKEVAKLVGISRGILSNKFKAIFEKLRDQHQKELKERLIAVLQDFKAQGRLITQQNVAAVLGISRGTIQWYPEFLYLVRQARKSQLRLKLSLRNEEDLLEEIHEAIRWLKERNLSFSQREVAKLVGISREILSKKFKAIFEKLRDQHQKELKERLIAVL